MRELDFFQPVGGIEKDYSSEVRAFFRPMAAGSEVFPISLGDCYVDKTATAMTWIEGADLSVFAGVAGSRKKLTLMDAAGKKLVAWIGEVGGGKTLGSELVTNTTHTGTGGTKTFSGGAGTIIGDVPDDWNVCVATGITATLTRTVGDDYFHLASVGITLYRQCDKTLTVGKLYQLDISVADLSAGAGDLRAQVSTVGQIQKQFSIASISSGANQFIFSASGIPTDVGPLFSTASGAEGSFVSTSLKPITDVPVTGVHLYTDKNGSTRGIAYDTGIDLNAITYASVSLSDSLAIPVTAGDCLIATKDGEAMFWIDGIGMAAFAGTDAGSTPFELTFVDGNGKKAVAYGGAVGGGETLGDSTLTNGDFSSGDTTGWIFTKCNGDVDTYEGLANTLRTVTTLGSYLFFNQSSLVGESGRLYKSYVKYFLPSANSGMDNFEVRCWSTIATVFDTAARQEDSWTITYSYVNAALGTGFVIYLLKGENPLAIPAGDILYIAECWYKPVTDVPVTGLHLMSAKNGTTRNMASVESGFNSNAVVSVEVRNA